MRTKLTFFEALKALRERLGKKQQEMADLLGVTVKGYQNWEYGVNTPRGKSLLNILELCPDDETRALFEEEGMTKTYDQQARTGDSATKPDPLTVARRGNRDMLLAAINTIYAFSESGDKEAEMALKKLTTDAVLISGKLQHDIPEKPMRKGT